MNDTQIVEQDIIVPKLFKKRGRKPKGGKIIQQITSVYNNTENKPNIILHLKCAIKDLDTITGNSQIESFHFSNNSCSSIELPDA